MVAVVICDGSLFFLNANFEVDEECTCMGYYAVLIGNCSRISGELAATIFMVCAEAL
jgi:hypothetical protein